MARQSKGKSSAVKQKRSTGDKEPSLPLWKAIVPLGLTGVSFTLSKLSLSPSHGGIPAVQYRTETLIISAALAFMTHAIFRSHPLLRPSNAIYLMAAITTWIPILQFALTPTARLIGPGLSAALINIVTLGPMVILSVDIMAPRVEFLMGFNRPGGSSGTVSCLVCAAILFATMGISGSYLPPIVGSHPLLTRPFLPLSIPPLLMVLLPSRRMLWLATVPYALLLIFNPYTSFSILAGQFETTLNDLGYTVIKREESLTGYLSVVENRSKGYRVLRCDHSLLGGEWAPGMGSWPGGDGYDGPLGVVGEPVYAVFVMLEAIRLVQDDLSQIENVKVDSQNSLRSMSPDNKAKALVIGLGIGTTPAAFISHGINTTIVEIDAAVYRIALEYFKLPKNHTAYIEDATAFVQSELDRSRAETRPDPAVSGDVGKIEVFQGRYDYIVHDVFTGGAEPVELFTKAFIQGLSDLLKPDGVVAINYASDFQLPSASYVFTTILSIFPNCRLFRDEEPAASSSSTLDSDFANMVLFCRKGNTPFMFRETTEGDYLGSEIRRMVLMPRYEIPLQQFVGEKLGGEWNLDRNKVLTNDRIKELEKWHAVGAARHWRLMRTVMPDVVWERW